MFPAGPGEADGHRIGSARLAVRLLDQVTASQARRITAASQAPEPAALSSILAARIPGHLHTPDLPDDDEWPGLYRIEPADWALT